MRDAAPAFWHHHVGISVPDIAASIAWYGDVLGFALEQTGDDSPNLGYATVYPVAMIAKILLAQVLLTLAR